MPTPSLPDISEWPEAGHAALRWAMAHPDEPTLSERHLEVPGARGARGILGQWTTDAGEVIRSPEEAASAQTATAEDRHHARYIGQPCVCLFVLRFDPPKVGATADIRFADGTRIVALVPQDVWFD